MSEHIKVKKHKRKGRSVRNHSRKKSAAWKKLHPRYKMWGDRPNSSTSMATLLKKKLTYTRELQKITSGFYSSVQEGHEAFIRRRLRDTLKAIKKQKTKS